MRLISAIALALALTIYPATTAIEPTPVPPPVVQIEPSRGGRVLSMQASAYCYTGNRTATGTWPKEGRTIAVDPEVIPLGVEVYVSCESWPAIDGVYIAQDVGGAIQGNRIDVYISDYETATQFGRRTVRVRVLGE